MVGEITPFRKRFIGGFNREDVVAYISKISSERNESIEAKEQCEAELKKLSEQISEINKKREETEREAEKLRLQLGEQISEINKKREEAEREVKKLRLQLGELQTRKELTDNEATKVRLEPSALRNQKEQDHFNPESKPVIQDSEEKKPVSNKLKVKIGKIRGDY